MAEKYRQKLLAEVQGITLEEQPEEIVSATDEPVEVEATDNEATENNTENNTENKEEQMVAAGEE